MVKKIGIVGGTAWPSTVQYYRLICERSEERFGVTPELAIESLDLRRAVSLIGDSDGASWAAFDAYHRDALVRLARSGCDVACFAANTPHHRFAEITRDVPVEVVNIVDAVAQTAVEHFLRNLFLLGTRLTMTSDVIKRRFSQAGITIAVPAATEQAAVVELIEGLQRGARTGAAAQIQRLSGGMPAILGCTELALAFPGEAGSAAIVRDGATYLNSLAIHAESVLHAAAA